MLTSTAEPAPAPKPLSLFPCLRICEGKIFLFTQYTNGRHSPMIAMEGDPDYQPNNLYTSSDLTKKETQETYLPYYGTVTIESRRD